MDKIESMTVALVNTSMSELLLFVDEWSMVVDASGSLISEIKNNGIGASSQRVDLKYFSPTIAWEIVEDCKTYEYRSR